MEASKTRETVLRGASSGLRNVWTPSRLRKSVEWDLDRCWRPPSLMDVWLFLTERRELQTAVQLSHGHPRREEKPVRVIRGFLCPCCTCLIQFSSWASVLSSTGIQLKSHLKCTHTHIGRCNPFEW